MNRADVYLRLWRIAPRLPIGLVRGLSDVAADLTWAVHGRSVRLMGANHARILGRRPRSRELRAAVRSHFRTYAEQFCLGGMSSGFLDASVRFDRFEELRGMTRDGPVVLALTHSGNWDLAGAWATRRGMGVLTVAERLDPPELFDAFLAFREGMGMEIIGAGRGESVFGRLVDAARDRSFLVPLLADRDITGSGIEVDLCGHTALVAAGPAALAERLGRPLVAGAIRYERVPEVGWGISVDVVGPVEPPGATATRTGVETHTQAWVDAVSPLLRRHVVDWHMMQPVFVEDLDPERLARSREKHLREERAPGGGGDR